MLFFGAAIPRLDINADTDAFLDEESHGIDVYYRTREEWGTDEFALLCFTADDWFTEEGIARLKQIDADLKAVSFVQSTLSVLDIPLLRQDPDTRPNLVRLAFNRKFLGQKEIDLAAAEKELATHELTLGNLISHDGRSLNVLAYLDVDDGITRDMVPRIHVRRTELVRGVRAVAEKWSAQMDQPVRMSGIPIIQITLYENMRQDLIVFGIASFALFVLAFFAVYRRPRFVTLPILCCLLPPIGMLGAMAFFEIPVGFVTSNMPVLLFVLLLPYNVYFIERYRERRVRHPDEDGLASTLAALRSIAIPCLFSCATTLAGFAALSTSHIVPFSDFGRTMFIGFAIGFCVLFPFIASASRRLPGISIVGPEEEEGHRPARGLVRWFEKTTLRRPRVIVGLSALVLVAAVAGAMRMNAETKITSYFWPNSPVYQGLEFVDQRMGGTTWIEVILTSDEAGYFLTDDGLRALEVVQEYFDEVPERGNVMSITSLRDEMRKTFRPEWFPDLTDAEILRPLPFVSPQLVGQTTRRGFSTARDTIRIKSTSPTLNRVRILNGLDEHLAKQAELFEGLKIEVTGIVPVYAEMIRQLLSGQKQSILAVAIAVYLMLIVLFRSPLLALIVLIPQAVPATVVLGIMGWTGIPLDLVTVMIASIAIGVGIDAAIQYTMRFRSELAAGHDHREAVRRSHATIGRAIWIATSIIIAGFAVLMLSRFFPSVWFGLFTAVAMLVSQLATLTLLPSIFLITGWPKKPSRDR